MLNLILQFLLSVFRTRQALILENAALRRQIEVLKRHAGRPFQRWRDRAFWDVLCSIWPNWRKSLSIVQPETVVRWHRKGFRFYWRWKSRYRWPGRPRVSRDVQELIPQMSEAFPWDTAPRYLIRDRDGIYGFDFTRRVSSLLRLAWTRLRTGTCKLIKRKNRVHL